jgi:TRAP-type uncharacterized transport system fused permease subunit
MRETSGGSTVGKIIDKIVTVLAVAMAAYHMVMTQFFLEVPILWQNTHLAFSLVIVFLLSMKKEKKRWWPLTLFFSF